jgi:hypothetical protein
MSQPVLRATAAPSVVVLLALYACGVPMGVEGWSVPARPSSSGTQACLSKQTCSMLIAQWGNWNCT